ncbi:MAG: esterase [Planctomycetaceae bacterium]|nr:esterase [Planctomycetaceae bacterium]
MMMSTVIEGTWSQIQIAGKTADVYEPANRQDHDHAVLHLHGHGLETLKDNPVFSAELEQYGLPTICPHGQRSWWTNVVCREFDENIPPIDFLCQHVVPEFASRWNIEPPNIGLTGISMGGQGALQLAYRYSSLFPVVAAIAPAVDFHNWHGRGLPIDEMFVNQEAARQATAILQIIPLSWPKHQFLCCDPEDHEWLESLERLSSKLYSSGIPFECDMTTSNGGHCWDYFNTMAKPTIQFVAEHLE